MDIRRRVLANLSADMSDISLVLNRGATSSDYYDIFSVDVVNSSGNSININLTEYRLISGNYLPDVGNMRYRIRDNNIIELTGDSTSIFTARSSSVPDLGTNLLNWYRGGAYDTSDTYKCGSILIDCNNMTILKYSPLICVDLGSRMFVLVYHQTYATYYYEVDTNFNIISKSNKSDSEIYSRISEAYESLYQSINLSSGYYGDSAYRHGIFTGKFSDNSVRYLRDTLMDGNYAHNYNYRTVNLINGNYIDEAVIYSSVNLSSISI